MSGKKDIWGMLIDWEDSVIAGEEIAPEVLCEKKPELLPVLIEKIKIIKATRWMDGVADDD